MQPILNIDLSSGKVEQIEVPRAWEGAYLGGASLAARMLFDHLVSELDPLSPTAALLILTGPLTGTYGPAVGRFVICGKSPATGLWAESNCGGFWGPELRKAGFDGLWVTGKAPKPVYLWIHNGQVEIKAANHLWGQDTYQIQTSIKSELSEGNARVLGIGPAGEHQVPLALILCDHGRVAGRTGLGAVMGSKNLKAIAVCGKGEIPLADPETYARLRSVANRELANDFITQSAREAGTAGVADYFDYLGLMPKKYYQSGSFDGVSKISGITISETILDGVSACHGCVVACGRVVSLEDGQRRKGPEYETIVGFGPNLLVDDIAAITILGELCDRYGMDTISVSNTIGLAYLLFEQGVITPEDTGGLELRWGDISHLGELIRQVAYREGFGAYLADGARSLGCWFGVEEQAIQVNGLEVAYHDPRGGSGMALVYATSPRGACHSQSDYYFVDVGRADEALGLKLFSRQAGAEKAANVARHQDWRTVFNALVMCFFANVPPKRVVDLINAAVGLDWDLEEMLRAGERAWNLKRVINFRLGLRKENDRLPKPLLKPLPDGGAAGYRIPLGDMLQAYYAARGWDPSTGFPTDEKLRQLGLEWVQSPI